MASPEIDQIVQYTKQFIEAATPIAKQAYEIGLVTLRIDAAQQIVFSTVVLFVAFLVLRKIKGDYAAAKVVSALPENKNRLISGPSDFLVGDGIPHILGGIIAILGGASAAIPLVSVWLWIKLFAPQLWLAHMAVEKLVG